MCGRCAQKTAAGSNYCPRCRWTLFSDLPDLLAPGEAPAIELEAPRSGGFLERKKLEHQAASQDKSLKSGAESHINVLEDKLQAAPGDSGVLAALGEWCLLDRQLLRAQALLQKAVENAAPPDALALNNLGLVQARLGFWAPALEALQGAAKASPQDSTIWSNLASVALASGRFDLALEAAQKLQENAGSEAAREEWGEEIATLRGLAHVGKKQWNEARAALNGALHLARARREKAPEEAAGEDADALNNLALAEANAGDLKSAVEHLRAALQAAPGHPRVLNNLGVLALQQGRADVALKYLRLATQIEEELEAPEPARINNLGVALAARGMLDESLEAFVQAGSFESAEFEVLYNLGRALIQWGKPDKGVEALKKAFALDPYNADVHSVLGAAYLLRGQEKLLPEAVKHLKRALQINSAHKVAQINMTLALRESNNEETAGRLLTQTLKSYPRSSEALFLGALMTMMHGGEPGWAAAGGQFQMVYDARPDAIASLHNGALCQFMMGFRDTASGQWAMVSQRDPSFVPAHYMMGLSHAAGARYAEAIKAWLNAVEYEPANVDLQANMGFAYYRQEKWTMALKSFMSAHGLEPGDADLLASLGLSFARAGMFPQAVTAFTQSLAINPRSPVTHSNIGLAYYLQKQIERAIDHWKIVSQLDRSYAEKREEDQDKRFDDSLVSLRPFRWRERVVPTAPSMPPPKMKLLPGFNARRLRPLFREPDAQKSWSRREEMERTQRRIAQLHAK